MKVLQRLFGQKSPPASTQLPAENETEGMNRCLTIGALTDRGLVRDHNEDALFTLNAVISQNENLLPMCLYIVADGMGGYEGGQEASDLAIRLVSSWVLDKIYRPFLTDTEGSTSRQPINKVLTEAIVLANAKLHERSPTSGTTLTCAFVLGTNAFLAHVGDSRAYLITRNTIRQITTDHSLVNRLIELGQITPEEAQTHPQRNMLYRALGRAGNLEVDTYLQSLPDNSSLLLCTDGLWGMVPDSEILSIIDGAPSSQAACRRLITRANENGGQDNITAVLVQI